MKHHSSSDSINQDSLIAALIEPSRYPHPVDSVDHLETHISHLLLAGDYAYKIKKPLNLGFLDFTSLPSRQFYCQEEIRLNRRLAPDLYLDCIPICGDLNNPIVNGDPNSVLEYAVKMRRFSQDALLDRCLVNGNLHNRHLDHLAQQLAEFHGTIDRAGDSMPFGSPDQVHRPVLENFTQIRPLLQNSRDVALLNRLEHWTMTAFGHLYEVLTSRKAEGFIRECHGDLHLGNMILRNDTVTIFDCIEFNPDLRWIDVMSDLGFLLMDLANRQVPTMARRLLNAYLTLSGDYGGLAVLSYYQVYRAMVRAKITAIRLHQPNLDPNQRQKIEQEYRNYLELAQDFTHKQSPYLVITHGVSGSGKTFITDHLLERLGAIRVRSDVERKRLFGLAPLEKSDSGLDRGLYTSESTHRTYQHLKTLAEIILQAGYPVIVDATFLQASQRRIFRDLAKTQGVPFVLLSCSANSETLRQRVAHRASHGDDAAEADIEVLNRQLQNYTPLPPEEAPLTTQGKDMDTLHRAILEQIHQAAITE